MEYPDPSTTQPVSAAESALADDVRQGLTAFPKRLSSRFFYDAEGSRLFQQIMHLPEYYLTRSEYEILDTYKAKLLPQFSGSTSFDLIELGAGDGLKTKVLLAYFLERGVSFTYMPIDISVDALDGLSADLRSQFPELVLEPQPNDYFQALEQLSVHSDRPKLVLFLGSNIGNFKPDDALFFYQQLADRLRPGDQMLTGFDLQKDPTVIRAAYNDKQGVTRDFNLNLLRRINRELDANFDLNAFTHVESYTPESGQQASYLVSQQQQQVYIDALDLTVAFAEGETIHTEISRKFSPAQIEQLAQQTGFTIDGWFTDSNGYFADVVFVKR